MSKRKRTEDETESSQQDVDLGGNSVIEQRLQFETERLAKLNLLSEQQEQVENTEKEVEILTGVQRKKPSANSESENNRRKNLEKNAEDLVAIQDEDARVKINVGGQTFVTSKQTLSNEETIFKIMMNTSLPIDRDENGAILVEEGRTPENFVIILDYLRSRKLNAIGLPLDDGQKLQELLDDSDFYGTAKLSNYLRQLIADKVETETLRLKRIEEQKQAEKDEEEEEVVEIEPVDEQANKKRDEEWMQKFSEMTLQQTKNANKYFEEKKSQLDQKKQELEDAKKEIFSKSEDKRFIVRLNVGGRDYDADLAILVKHKESIFVKAFEKLGEAEKSTLFIDRDPDLFNYIIEHLRTGKTSHIPFTDAAKSRQIREEAKYFNIPTLIEFFDPLRYPIETIGEENIKMKHNEDALRRLFAKDRSNPLLDDPYLHLLPVFEVRESFNQGDAPPSVPLMFNFEATANLGNQKNVPHPPAPRLTSTKQEFIDQFDAFTTGLFDGVDWSNVFAAGGGVLASAMKVENSAQKRTHNANFGTTDEEADGEITGLNVTKLYGEDDDLEDIEEVDNMEEEEEEEETFDEDVFTDSDDESRKQPMSSMYGQPPNVTSTIKAFSSDPYRSNIKALTPKTLNPLQKLVNHYEASIYNGSDIDLFLYGISEQEAEAKIVQLYNQFKLNLRKEHLKKYTTQQTFKSYYHHYGGNQAETKTDDIFVIRTKQAVTFHFAYPIRPVQIILRIYKSPAEVLMGFDLDCCTFGYDGNQVWALPRARRAIAARMNLVDVDRQSTTYEVRLFKYAKRGFRVGVPGYDASKIKNSSLLDSDLYDRLRQALDSKGITRKYKTNIDNRFYLYQRRNYKERHGLSRLILLERSVGQEFRDSLSNIGLTNSHAPNALGLAEQEVRSVDPREERERSYKEAREDKQPTNTGRRYGRYRRSHYKPKSKTSDYASIFIPFSRRWSPQNTFNRFQGTIQFIKESVNKNYAPEFMYQLNDIKSVLEGNAMDSDLAGPVEWMTVDPGTQMVGSFNPVDTNFYQDAYERSDEQREVLKLVMQQKTMEESDHKEKEKLKKRVKIVWSWDTGKSKYQPYDKDVIVKIEKQYRLYQNQLRSGNHWYMAPVDSVEITAMHKIDFKKMQQVQIKDSTKTRKVKREKIKVGKAWERHEKKSQALSQGNPVFNVDDDEEEDEDY